MPPKPKFTKEEIIAAALELVSEKGMGALTARDLGTRLGSSARPIFTVFRNMEEVQREVRAAALRRFEDYAGKAVDYTPAFKQFGMQMVLFANEEPKLFQLLFMTENARARSFDDILADLGEPAQVCIGLLETDYGLTRRDAMQLFQHVWIHTFGIGALCAARVCSFSEDEVSHMLTRDFTAMIMLLKSGGPDGQAAAPAVK